MLASLYQGLFALEYQESLAPDGPVEMGLPGPSADLEDGWGMGRPVLVAHPPQIQAAEFLRTMQLVKDIFNKHQPERRELREPVHDALAREIKQQGALVAGILGREETILERLGAGRGLSMEEAALLINHTSMLYLRRYASEVRARVDLNHWGHGPCPICGGRARLARLDGESGKRHLYCAACDIEWPFKRIGCPHCGNQDQDTLRFFTVEGQDGYRVHVCAGCRGYIKTVDERVGGGVKGSLFWEDLRTGYLDMLALREGYSFVPSPVRAS